MKNLKIPVYLLLLVVFFGCSKDTEGPSNKKKKKVSPSDAAALSKVLQVENSSRKTGVPPSSLGTSSITLAFNQSEAEITVDNKFYLPFVYDNTGSDLSARPKGIYIQVDGANDYFELASIIAPNKKGILNIPVKLPDNVLAGNFSLKYAVYDQTGKVSDYLFTNVIVKDSLSGCDLGKSGSSGLTIISYDLGDKAGTANMFYNTYSIPDRIDIFYNGTWIRGTGSTLTAGQFPPIYIENDFPITEGYTGETGNFTFPYNPSVSRKIDVYISGALGGSTAWDIKFDCIP